jgi:hypothetical protein
MFWWSMILSENRIPPWIKSGAGFFGIMLQSASPYPTVDEFAIRKTPDSLHLLREDACRICDRKRAGVSRIRAHSGSKAAGTGEASPRPRLPQARAADLARTALPTRVLPSFHTAPVVRCAAAMTASNDCSIHAQSSSEMVSDGNSLIV